MEPVRKVVCFEPLKKNSLAKLKVFQNFNLTLRKVGGVRQKVYKTEENAELKGYSDSWVRDIRWKLQSCTSVNIVF